MRNEKEEYQKEYEKRLNEQKRLIKELKTKNPVHLLECEYDNERFEKIANGLENEPERGHRCLKCYRLRLEETVKKAKENNLLDELFNI